MRRVRATLTLSRAALTCAALLLLLASCGTGDDGDGHAPGAPVGVTAAAGSATSVHVMWDAVTASPAVGTYEIYRGTTKVKEVPGSEHMVDVRPRVGPGLTDDPHLTLVRDRLLRAARTW